MIRPLGRWPTSFALMAQELVLGIPASASDPGTPFRQRRRRPLSARTSSRGQRWPASGRFDGTCDCDGSQQLDGEGLQSGGCFPAGRRGRSGHCRVQLSPLCRLQLGSREGCAVVRRRSGRAVRLVRYAAVLPRGRKAVEAVGAGAARLREERGERRRAEEAQRGGKRAEFHDAHSSRCRASIARIQCVSRM